jgi:iron complex outermembrane receptor protein
MSLYTGPALLFGLLFSLTCFSQQAIKGKILDVNTNEPIHGASLSCQQQGCKQATSTDASGNFTWNSSCLNVIISYIGYTNREFNLESGTTVFMSPSASLLNTVVLTANRGEAVKRSQAPVAISSINHRLIQDTRASSLDQLLNKVSGVNMVNLGNEQHQMSIRQPMTTKSLFLYLEDGIPVRTTGLFNHNALLEMNMAAVKNIEVIKGPSSSLYGSEAIGGVVNFITAAPAALPMAKVSTQASTLGYKRADLQSTFSGKKWGYSLNGYYADKKNSFLEYTSFHKGVITARVDHKISDQTKWIQSATWLNYYTDMPGGVDSNMFTSRIFSNPQTFTYRRVNAIRYRSTLQHAWNPGSHSGISLVYRKNTIGQNPAYRIRDDYKKTGNAWAGKKDLAHGEINESSFQSYALIAQHKENFSWKKAAITSGFSLDLSPSAYEAKYIRIVKDTITKKYREYQAMDSTLSSYDTRINNWAAFGNFELTPLKNLRVVISIRYDHFIYRFNNQLVTSAFSGSTDTVNRFSRISPKFGLTYSLSSRAGLYANYSQGFVPPQVTEMYTGVKVPSLSPSVFHNYELGGWAEMIPGKLSADISLYQLRGTNEVISVRLEDGSTENRNAGETDHRGVELGIMANPLSGLSLRFSAALSRHRFIRFTEKGINYSGLEMNGAPAWIHQAEVWYRPSFVKGLRLGLETQYVGRYFMDPRNTQQYKGYHVLHFRAGYAKGAMEIWMNLLNATNLYYSYLSVKTNSAHSYQLAEPRNLTIGISCDLAKLKKSK